MHACLGVPGELNALALVRGSGGMSITVMSSESRVDRSGVFRGALTVTKVQNPWRGEVWEMDSNSDRELPNVSSMNSVRNCVNVCVNGHGVSKNTVTVGQMGRWADGMVMVKWRIEGRQVRNAKLKVP